jgi:thioredoxin 1
MSSAIHVSEVSFDEQVLASKQPVVIDFWAEWCAPCRRIAPLLDEIAERYEGRALVAKVNVDEEPDLVEQHGIRTIPTFLFVRDGEVVDRASGVLTRARLDARIDALLAAPEGPHESQPTSPEGETK